MSGDTEAKEVEKCDAQGDNDTRPQNGWIINHLVPTAGEVKEGRTGSPCGDEGHEGNDCCRPKETFETDSIEGGDGVLFHNCFFDDELGGSADNGSSKVRIGDDGDGRYFTDNS